MVQKHFELIFQAWDPYFSGMKKDIIRWNNFDGRGFRLGSSRARYWDGVHGDSGFTQHVLGSNNFQTWSSCWDQWCFFNFLFSNVENFTSWVIMLPCYIVVMLSGGLNFKNGQCSRLERSITLVTKASKSYKILQIPSKSSEIGQNHAIGSRNGLEHWEWLGPLGAAGQSVSRNQRFFSISLW